MTLSRTTLTSLAAVAVLTVALTSCGSDDESPAGTTEGNTNAAADEPADGDDAADSGSDSGSGVSLPGTGTYVVGKDAPIGGYEWPDVVDQPAGCTWSALGKNNEVIAEDQGNTVFLTDVVVTFKTDGCPDWVQFE